MKRYGKLFGCLVLGMVVTAIIYELLVFVIVEPMRARSGRSPEAYIGLAYLVMAPIGVFFGSALTGFVSYPNVRTKLGFAEQETVSGTVLRGEAGRARWFG